jgi:ABC-2 type transport system ATP-binding protein
MTPRNTGLRLEGVVKRYGSKAALDGVSLQVAPGSVFGLLGPNGAGKTTAVQVVMGLVRPSAGQVWIGDVPLDSPQIHAARRGIGYLPDESLLYDHLTGREFLTFVGSVQGLGPGLRPRIARALALGGLEEDADRLVRTYSLGMKRRIAFMTAALADPDILVLDEPTGSLDVTSARIVRTTIAELRDRGAAVLLATHQMDLVERVCDRVGVLVRGTLRFEGTLDDLRRLHGRGAGEPLDEIFVRLTSQSGDLAAPEEGPRTAWPPGVGAAV